MKIVICPDKFKGTISAWEVTNIISKALLDFNPELLVVEKPMADGGDGTMELLYGYSNEKRSCIAFDAMRREIVGEYVILDSKIAVIEMSQSVGLAILDSSLHNPEKTSSYGFGVVIKDAIENGYKELLLCIGGSATNDCGVGMLSALGVVFFDVDGMEVFPCGGNLSLIENYDISKMENLIEGCCFEVACDVTNPLFGENGATKIYAAQKGADTDMVQRLECGVKHFWNVVKRVSSRDMNISKGAGAAGGIGAALECFLFGKLTSGAGLIAQKVGLEQDIETADLIITAEGMIDNQTQNGKLIDVVERMAKKYNCKIVAFCGVKSKSYMGDMDIYSLTDDGTSIIQAMTNGKKLLYELVRSKCKEILL